MYQKHHILYNFFTADTSNFPYIQILTYADDTAIINTSNPPANHQILAKHNRKNYHIDQKLQKENKPQQIEATPYPLQNATTIKQSKLSLTVTKSNGNQETTQVRQQTHMKPTYPAR